MPKLTAKLTQILKQSRSARNRIFLNPYIFYPESCEPGLKPLWREVSNQCGSGADRIHWFRVDARPIRVKKYAVLKISGFVWK